MYRHITIIILCIIVMLHVSNNVLNTVYLFLRHVYVYVYCITVFFTSCSSIISVYTPYITYFRQYITLIATQCDVNIANCQCAVLHCITLYDYG